MKVRSKPLYTYLFESGVLNGTPEEIDRAKCAYRRIYQQQWKQLKRPRKELRVEFTLKQYAFIKSKASEYDLKPTTYACNLILASIESKALIPHKETLLHILQLVSMSVIASARHMPSSQLTSQLVQAEELLLNYVTR